MAQEAVYDGGVQRELDGGGCRQSAQRGGGCHSPRVRSPRPGSGSCGEGAIVRDEGIHFKEEEASVWKERWLFGGWEEAGGWWSIPVEVASTRFKVWDYCWYHRTREWPVCLHTDFSGIVIGRNAVGKTFFLFFWTSHCSALPKKAKTWVSF